MSNKFEFAANSVPLTGTEPTLIEKKLQRARLFVARRAIDAVYANFEGNTGTRQYKDSTVKILNAMGCRAIDLAHPTFVNDRETALSVTYDESGFVLGFTAKTQILDRDDGTLIQTGEYSTFENPASNGLGFGTVMSELHHAVTIAKRGDLL